MFHRLMKDEDDDLLFDQQGTGNDLTGREEGQGVKLKTVEEALEEISKELQKVDERREKILKDVRDVISSSAKAIVATHAGDLTEAKRCLRLSNRILLRLRKLASDDLRHYLIQPEAEFVEASILLAVASKRGFPTRQNLKVSGVSYILGLLDSIGEVKRMIYDMLRKGKGREALKLFTVVEKIYTLIFPLAIYAHEAPGLRRKLDVARTVIEDTRSVITEEVRRAKFLRALERLQGHKS
ncbi:MAG: RNA-binding protein [Nitrososphaerota archaeon]